MADIFSISDSESEPLEEVGSWEMDQSVSVQDMNTVLGHSLTGPALRLAGELGNRVRMNSESQASTSCGEWAEQFQGRGSGEDDMPADGAPFRGRSQSAPPALWAAKKYGRQLRRMSDEFDVWLDKGEMKRVRSAGGAKQMHQSPSWWAFLFSHQETEGETPHNNLTSTEPRASE